MELGIRATTSEVATRAGIAEGTIFHRFKSKQELFRAAMNFDPDAALALVNDLPLQPAAHVGERDASLRQALLRFAEGFMAFGRIAIPVMMMSWSNPESQMCAERTDERTSRYRKVLGGLSAFFEREMAAGNLRRADPEVMARMLVGSLHHFCMSELFMDEPKSQLGRRAFAERVVDVLLAKGVDG